MFRWVAKISIWLASSIPLDFVRHPVLVWNPKTKTMKWHRRRVASCQSLNTHSPSHVSLCQQLSSSSLAVILHTLCDVLLRSLFSLLSTALHILSHNHSLWFTNLRGMLMFIKMFYTKAVLLCKHCIPAFHNTYANTTWKYENIWSIARIQMEALSQWISTRGGGGGGGGGWGGGGE